MSCGLLRLHCAAGPGQRGPGGHGWIVLDSVVRGHVARRGGSPVLSCALAGLAACGRSYLRQSCLQGSCLQRSCLVRRCLGRAAPGRSASEPSLYAASQGMGWPASPEQLLVSRSAPASGDPAAFVRVGRRCGQPGGVGGGRDVFSGQPDPADLILRARAASDMRCAATRDCRAGRAGTPRENELPLQACAAAILHRCSQGSATGLKPASGSRLRTCRLRPPARSDRKRRRP